MGSSSSLPIAESNCCDVCNCFIGDKAVLKREVIRNCKLKWVWTKHHDAILRGTLNTSYCIPTDIISLIKEHISCKNRDYFISKSALCQEPYYSITNKLWSKQLCSKWYQSHYSAFDAFTTALIGNNSNTRKHIFDTFINDKSSVLSLRSVYSGDNSKRTIYIDQCCVTIRVSNINLQQNEFVGMDRFPEVVLCTIEKKDDINDIDNMIQKMKNINKCNLMTFILVGIETESNVSRRIEVDQLCRKYNISYIKSNLDSEKSIHEMFVYAVKCHWFSMVSWRLMNKK